MYDELVKRLRNRRICVQSGGDLEKDFPLLKEAADAIEKLGDRWAMADKLIKMLEMPRWIPVTERLQEERKMTNKEVFEILFDISMEQLREMPGDALIKWEKEINKVLWGGFNGGTIPSFQAEKGET